MRGTIWHAILALVCWSLVTVHHRPYRYHLKLWVPMVAALNPPSILTKRRQIVMIIPSMQQRRMRDIATIITNFTIQLLSPWRSSAVSCCWWLFAGCSDCARRRDGGHSQKTGSSWQQQEQRLASERMGRNKCYQRVITPYRRYQALLRPRSRPHHQTWQLYAIHTCTSRSFPQDDRLLPLPPTMSHCRRIYLLIHRHQSTSKRLLLKSEVCGRKEAAAAVIGAVYPIQISTIEIIQHHHLPCGFLCILHSSTNPTLDEEEPPTTIRWSCMDLHRIQCFGLPIIQITCNKRNLAFLIKHLFLCYWLLSFHSHKFCICSSTILVSNFDIVRLYIEKHRDPHNHIYYHCIIALLVVYSSKHINRKWKHS